MPEKSRPRTWLSPVGVMLERKLEELADAARRVPV